MFSFCKRLTLYLFIVIYFYFIFVPLGIYTIFTIQYYRVYIYFPINIISYFIMSFLFLLFYFYKFSHLCLLGFFLNNLIESSSFQNSRILVNFLTDLNRAVVWILPQISNFFSLLSKPLGIVPSTLTTIGVVVTFMSHGYFSFLEESICLSFRLLLFSLCASSGSQNILDGKFFVGFFLLININTLGD